MKYFLYSFVCVNVEVAGMLGKPIKGVKSSCYSVVLLGTNHYQEGSFNIYKFLPSRLVCMLLVMV